MLTMLGFVILTGAVVNNAILMIEQAMLHIREEAMDVADAVVEVTEPGQAYFHVDIDVAFWACAACDLPGSGS